ncbi:MAG TPA: hypothetical protein VN238_20510 [Solirubrobacteraceae bacterium]|nr:hypothetical protein [Solirubrobacteraceae bacterium]
MRLRLVQTAAEAPTIDAFASEPFDLRAQPLRPGVAHEAVILAPGPNVRAAIAEAGPVRGPFELWLTIAVEAARSVDEASRALRVAPAELRRALDAAAAVRPDSVLGRGRRLAAYARELRASGPAPTPPSTSPIHLAVPYVTAVAWERDAARTQQKLDAWIVDRLRERRQSDTTLWEAAAAEAGQMLSEWCLSQAARRASSWSAEPQT